MLSLEGDDAYGESREPLLAEGTTPFRPNQPTRLLAHPTSCEPLEKRRADKPLSRGHEKRRRLREIRLQKEGYVPRRKTLEEHVHSATAITSCIDFSAFPATNGAYSAKLSPITSPTIEHSVPALVANGFELIQWDG